MKLTSLTISLCFLAVGACGDDDGSTTDASAPEDAPIVDTTIVDGVTDTRFIDTSPDDGAVMADCRSVCAHAIGVCPDFAEMEACVISCMEGIDQGTLDCINASTDCDSANACLAGG